MINIQDKKLTGKTFIDLFAGIGGFHAALSSLGATCVYASEIDKEAQKVYLANYGMQPMGDITQIPEDTIPDHDILCAGFPCQPFSIAGAQQGLNDVRGTLFFEVARIAKEKQPSVVFMENVAGLLTHDSGNTFNTIQTIINMVGYNMFYAVLNAKDYGVPQVRKRLYMVCFRKDLNITSFSFPQPFVLTRHVEDIIEGGTDADALFDKAKNLAVTLTGKSDNAYSDKPIRLGTVGGGHQGERVYSTKGAAITLCSSSGGVFSNTGGYMIDNKARKLTPLECARLMGFEDNFSISKRQKQAYKQFGNSVVVDVIQLIAQLIADKI